MGKTRERDTFMFIVLCSKERHPGPAEQPTREVCLEGSSAVARSVVQQGTLLRVERTLHLVTDAAVTIPSVSLASNPWGGAVNSHFRV